MSYLYFVNIAAKNGSYSCSLHEVYSSKSYPEFGVQLGANDSLTIKGETLSFKALLKKLADYKPDDLAHFFDDRGQLEIGQHLFNEIFRLLSEPEQIRLCSAAVEVRIVTGDEHIGRLPWCLLACREIFLTTEKWSVALSANLGDCIDCLLPPSPRVLFVIPQPKDWGDTEGESHSSELEQLLSTANQLHTLGKHLRVVETWNELVSTLTSWQPHILYFYGHGDATPNASRLVFSNSVGKGDIRSVADLANLLRSQSDQPKVIYINCCKGDVGGLLGVSFQFGSFIPSVITNCTTARVDAAREQARTVWKNILVNGMAPHEAIISMRRHVAGANFSFNDIRWMTPVLHYRYKKWEFKAPANESRLQLKPNWDNLLNRTKQTGEVILRVGSMLHSYNRNCLAFLWHGHQGQGVEQFYQRLKLEIQDHFPEIALYEVTPAWPQELHNFHRSISDMLVQAFEVATIDEIPHAIRFQMLKKGAHRAVAYLRHPVLDGGTELADPTQLQNYLEWLDKNLAAQLDESTCLLIGFGLEYNSQSPVSSGIPSRRKAYDELESVEFNWLTFYILEELGEVVRRDLLDFMLVHNYQLPKSIRENLIKRILEKTGGQYQKVLQELKDAF
ncbi:MAG TPA: hypothetical protein VJT15_03405 [Pyrinomonadaceae bacterium]|nr:hypothetical protein [Pyrinomonadaceae bacterium]